MIKINGLVVDQFVFPGGEVNIRLPEGLKAPMDIIAWTESSDDVMALALTFDALRRHYGAAVKTQLTIPYYPYARQDRVCSTGEALSKEVFFKMITTACHCNFTSYDVHSHSDKVRSIGLISILNTIDPTFTKDTILIAPDAGSTVKVQNVADYYKLPMLQGYKIRDPKTGELSGFDIEDPNMDLSDKHLVILDDICDGGGTFVGLAAVIKAKLNPKSLSLYVTHGIFSRGFTALEEHFDMIYTTDTISKEWLPRKQLKIFKVVGIGN